MLEAPQASKASPFSMSGPLWAHRSQSAAELLEEDAKYYDSDGERRAMLVEAPEGEAENVQWRPFTKGGYMDVDSDELLGFDEDGEWDLLEDESFDPENFEYDDDEIWTSS